MGREEPYWSSRKFAGLKYMTNGEYEELSSRDKKYMDDLKSEIDAFEKKQFFFDTVEFLRKMEQAHIDAGKSCDGIPFARAA
jgi:hypothetical protein